MTLCVVGLATCCTPKTKVIKVPYPVPLVVRCRIGSPPPIPEAPPTTKGCEWGACYTLLHARRLALYIGRLQRYAQDAYVLCSEGGENDDGE